MDEILAPKIRSVPLIPQKSQFVQSDLDLIKTRAIFQLPCKRFVPGFAMTFACMTTPSCTRQILVVDWKVCQLWKPSRVGITIQNELDLPKSVSFVCHSQHLCRQFLTGLFIFVRTDVFLADKVKSKQPRKILQLQSIFFNLWYIVWLQQQRSIFLKGCAVVSPKEGSRAPRLCLEAQKNRSSHVFFVETSNGSMDPTGGFYRFSDGIHWPLIHEFLYIYKLICGDGEPDFFLWGMLVTYTLNWPLNLVFFLNMVFFCHAYFHVSPELLQFLVNCREVKLIVAMLFGCFWQCFRSIWPSIF